MGPTRKLTPRSTADLDKLRADLEAVNDDDHPAFYAYERALAKQLRENKLPLIGADVALRRIIEARENYQYEWREHLRGMSIGIWWRAELLAELMYAHWVYEETIKRINAAPEPDHSDLAAWWSKRKLTTTRRPVTDGYVRTGRTVRINGERIPIVERVP